MIKRNKKGLWEKGQSGNPSGRPKSDRTIAMRIIFKLMEKYQDKFEEEMEKLIQKDPVEFYRKYVKDIQPNISDIDGHVGSVAPVINIQYPKDHADE